MLRFVFVIVISLPFIIYYMSVGAYIEKHSDRYSEEDRYKVAGKVILCLKRKAFIDTEVYGRENLPNEGGYCHNRNEVHEFLPGAFKSSIRSKTPIVPVAIIDSYKPFEVNSLKRVKTQVHYLPPIYYSEYKNLTTVQIAELVRERIVNKINNELPGKKAA